MPRKVPQLSYDAFRGGIGDFGRECYLVFAFDGAEIWLDEIGLDYVARSAQIAAHRPTMAQGKRR